MRETFLERFDKQATKNNYIKAFIKLDEFLRFNVISEQEYFLKLRDGTDFKNYNHLQELINFIKNSVSPSTCRLYFDCLFTYFLLEGIPLDYTQKRLRVKFPRIVKRKYEGVDHEVLDLLIGFASYNFGLYLKMLAGSGLRETEGLLLEPGMIKFNEHPVRMVLPGRITKFSVPRETFLPTNTAKRILELINENDIKETDTIFTRQYSKNTLVDFEKYFAVIRRKAGLDTVDKMKNQKNDITLHSCRAFFITVFTDSGQHDFGHALAGHNGYLETYYRKSLKERQSLYASVMSKIDFN